jgi:predicted nucleotidyltransferase
MRAGPESLPREARAALDEYLAALDAALPGIAHGIYITGSAALGDWRPGRSDLDILTLTASGLTDGELTALEKLHAASPGRPYRDAIYIPAEAIGPDPAADRRYPSAVDGVFQRERYRPDPVLWATLDRHGLTVRGPEAHTLRADPGEAWLREWNHGNLESYWPPWAASTASATTASRSRLETATRPVSWSTRSSTTQPLRPRGRERGDKPVQFGVGVVVVHGGAHKIGQAAAQQVELRVRGE